MSDDPLQDVVNILTTEQLDAIEAARERAVMEWRQQAEAAEQWQTQVPWSALRSVLDAAFQFAQGNGELWADCEKVEAWAEVHEIGDESCATIHPETWQSVTAKLGQTIVRPEFPVDPVDYE